MKSIQGIVKHFENGQNKLLSQFREKAPNVVGGLGEFLEELKLKLNLAPEITSAIILG